LARDVDNARLSTPEERLGWLSTHEAGHAVVAWHCPLVGSVTDMIIEPTRVGDALWQGRVVHDWNAPPEAYRAWDIVIALAGLSAEMLCYGQVRTLLLRDLDEALAGARLFCRQGTYWSLGAAPGAPPMPFTVRCTGAEALALGQAWGTACALLMYHRDAHARLASIIAVRRRLNEAELAGILGPR
jgi:hypothetical protein